MNKDVDCGDMTLGKRKLRDEPLDLTDWEQVYDAYRGFQYQVRLIVKRARARQMVTK